jgi:uncharacterized protein
MILMNFQYESNRIYAVNEAGVLLAEVTFPNRDEKRVNVDHVFVDESLRGQGIAGELMMLAYDYLKGRNLLIVAKCPYAIAWFKKNPNYQDIVINVKTKAGE